MNEMLCQCLGYGLKATISGSTAAGAPQIVLVHGMMESGSVWQSVLLHLAPRYCCVTLELPWNGMQGGLWGMKLAPQEWLAKAITKFELRPDVWIAHSFGASALLKLLANDRVIQGARAPAILISPFYKASTDEVTWPLFQQYVNDFTQFVELSIRTRMQHHTLEPGVLRRMTEAARDSFGCYVWTEFWRLFSRMPFLPMHRVDQPVLLLAGKEDFSSPLPDVQALFNALPDATLLSFSGASHFLLSSRREGVENAIKRFLARNCPALRPTTGRRVSSTVLLTSN